MQTKLAPTQTPDEAANDAALSEYNPNSCIQGDRSGARINANWLKIFQPKSSEKSLKQFGVDSFGQFTLGDHLLGDTIRITVLGVEGLWEDDVKYPEPSERYADMQEVHANAPGKVRFVLNIAALLHADGDEPIADEGAVFLDDISYVPFKYGLKKTKAQLTLGTFQADEKAPKGWLHEKGLREGIYQVYAEQKKFEDGSSYYQPKFTSTGEKVSEALWEQIKDLSL